MANTVLANLINPQVMADMVSANLPKKLKFSRIAAINTELAGRAGNTITVPKYAYIGDAEDVAEGVEMGTVALSTSTVQATVKKAGKALSITDESLLSGYGNPAGEATAQLLLSVASKIDEDCVTELGKATLKYNGSTGVLDYAGITKAVDMLQDESDTPLAKVIFIHPNQLTQLRLDPNFLTNEKYPMNTVMTGVIGMVAGCQVVVSKRVKEGKVGGVNCYLNPIVVVDSQDPNQDNGADGFAETTPALTIYMKRAVEMESERKTLSKTTIVSVDEHYTVVLSNDSKVVIGQFAKAAA